MEVPVQWLMEGPSWVRYRTLVDLLGRGEDDGAVCSSRDDVISDPAILKLVTDLRNWPGYPLQRHNDARHPLHKLAFLADIGLNNDDPWISGITTSIMEDISQEGVFQITVNIPTRFGGSGEDEYAWMLCDAPLAVYSLARLGLADHPMVKHAMGYLVGLVEDYGWPCAASSRFGENFRGPGRKGDPCPYATLLMLRALTQFPGLSDSPAGREGALALLDLWKDRKQRRPYLFAMGTHFNRLKAPLIWYDILHVMEVLSQFPCASGDPRLLEMAELLAQKSGEGGVFKAESIWKAWSDWEFGQKRTPSRWITLLTHRILGRIQPGS